MTEALEIAIVQKRALEEIPGRLAALRADIEAIKGELVGLVEDLDAAGLVRYAERARSIACRL